MRLHQTGDGPTLEGFLANSFNDHYRLLKPLVWETADRSHSLSDEVWVPREKVLFVETVRT